MRRPSVFLRPCGLQSSGRPAAVIAARMNCEKPPTLNGRPPLPEGEDEMVRVWYAKMLVRIARGDLESKYRRIELLYQALENYFKLRRLWYRGAKAALPWLARHDPETHAALARAFEAHGSLDDLRALVQRILPAQ